LQPQAAGGTGDYDYFVFHIHVASFSYLLDGRIGQSNCRSAQSVAMICFIAVQKK
jgi:hypothetical protein